MALKRTALILLCLCLLPAAYAETVFVGDNLRIGIRPEPGTHTAPVRVVGSGDRLEILEQRETYSRVRAEDGTSGWVRNIYISQEPPARLILDDIRTKLRETAQQLQQAQQALAAVRHENTELQQTLQQLSDEAQTLRDALAALQSQRHNNTWIYILVAALSLCGLAFTLGILWNKQQVAKKLGGQSL